MEFNYLELHKEEGIGTIILNRPECSNALNLAHAEDLIRALENCCEDENVNAIIITGAGKDFCSGGDLKASRENPEGRSEYWKHLTRRLNRIIVNIRYTRKPVIASLNGAALGAGMSIACACDLRIAGESASFRQAWTSVGLVPDGAWTLLVPLTVGMGKASELIFMDPVLDSSRAFNFGLVNLVVPDSELREETRKWAIKLANGPFEALARSKELLNESMLHILEAQLGRERREIVEAARTKDHKEAVEAFLNKRTPIFKGI